MVVMTLMEVVAKVGVGRGGGTEKYISEENERVKEVVKVKEAKALEVVG